VAAAKTKAPRLIESQDACSNSPPPRTAHYYRMLRRSPGEWLQRATVEMRRYRFGLTAPRLLLDDCDAWTLNASLTRLSSYRKCSKRRTLGRSAQATSLLPIEDTTICSRKAHGFGSGSGTGFAAEVKPKAGFGFRASAAFLSSASTSTSFRIPVLRPLLKREALGFSPLMQAGWAHSPGVERVPCVATGARPQVILPGRPAAERASDARAGGVEAFVLVRLAVQNGGRFGGFIGEGAHATVS